MDYMVSEIARVQQKHGDGYAGPVRTEAWKNTFSGTFDVHQWGLGGGYVPWYVLYRTYAGLIDAYVYAGNEQALEVARKFADWAKKGTDNLDDEQFQKMLRCEFGGMGVGFAGVRPCVRPHGFIRQPFRSWGQIVESALVFGFCFTTPRRRALLRSWPDLCELSLRARSTT